MADPFGVKAQAEEHHECGHQQLAALAADIHDLTALVTRQTALIEALLSETKRTVNRGERTDGRVERIEYAVDAMLTWLAERAGPDAGVPRFPRTQLDIPDLEQWRARRVGRLVAEAT